MTKKLLKYDIFGFIFVSVVGTVAHFIYEWSGESVAAALFCPINESPWEHLKLIFFPYLIWTIIQAAVMKNIRIMPAKFIGVVSSMAIILAIYYTVSGITGRNIDFVNILSFFIGVFCAFAIDYAIIKSSKLQNKQFAITVCVLFAIQAGLFFLFTFAPPLIPLFKDPISATYGI